MPIKKPSELDFSNLNVSILLVGRPACGKTSLACSASKPLVVDIEDGIGRVEACYRKDTLVVERTLTDEEKYKSLINDLTTSDLSEYNTLIMDSVGKFMEIVTPVVIKENPANAQKDGKTLSLKGYGAIASKFKDLNKLIKSLHKDVVWIAHCTEIQDNDTIKVRVSIPGSTKDSIWDDIDLGGYIEFLGKKRVIHFTPSEKYDAKGTHGIKGTYEIPELKDTANGGKPEDNTFLTQLLNNYKQEIIDTQKKYATDSVVYNKAIELAANVKSVKTIDELNSVVETIKNTQHALTSKEELLAHVSAKAKELGAAYDKESKRYKATA